MIVASFVLQVFALISPLFFQVVIDKVLVHRGLTTLDAWRDWALARLVVMDQPTYAGATRTKKFRCRMKADRISRK